MSKKLPSDYPNMANINLDDLNTMCQSCQMSLCSYCSLDDCSCNKKPHDDATRQIHEKLSKIINLERKTIVDRYNFYKKFNPDNLIIPRLSRDFNLTEKQIRSIIEEKTEIS